ncbi:MAG: Tim44/TimA family putative adaptor protein [Bdellovibrionales bacterium]
METDILIYAIIAIVIFARLWSLLGQKNSDEPERPNPFASRPTQNSADDDEETFARPLANNSATTQPNALPAPRAAPDSLAGGLEKIRELDTTFDEKKFLQGARAAFLMIVEDYLKGDLSRSERLLSPSIRSNFQAAIDARKAQNEIVENKSLKLKDAECVVAKVEDKIAKITVRFVSAQDNRIYRASEPIDSQPDSNSQIEEITDLWTFTRDTSSQDPNWALSETRS